MRMALMQALGMSKKGVGTKMVKWVPKGQVRNRWVLQRVYVSNCPKLD